MTIVNKILFYKQKVFVTRFKEEWQLKMKDPNNTVVHRSFGRPAKKKYGGLWKAWYEFGSFIRQDYPNGKDF